MDVETFRGIERLLVIAAGTLAVYLGYRLFLNMPERNESEGKFKLPGGVSIYISRVGPGVFFALFGAAVVGLSFHYPLVIESSGQQIAESGQMERQVTFRQSYLGGSVSPEEIEQLRLARLRVRDHIGFLNGLNGALRSDLPEDEQGEIARRVQNAKLDMIEAVWGNWGDLEAFRDWVRRGASGAAPEGLDEPAALYLHRKE